MNAKRVNIILMVLFIVPASIYAKTQTIKHNNVEFILTDCSARDSISFPGFIIPQARSFFQKKIIPLCVVIKNMTEQDIVFSPSCVLQADTQDLYNACKYSQVNLPMAIQVTGCWVAALSFIAEQTAYLRGAWSTRGGIAAVCALSAGVLSLWQEHRAKQKNKKIKDALQARVQEMTISAGGTYSTILFIDEVDLWQQPVISVCNVQQEVIASCPLDLRLSFNFSQDIGRAECEGGLK